MYGNQTTGEQIAVHTKRIEGCLKHAKEHFKRMSGTQHSQFEGHFTEVMWRSEVKGKVYELFQLVLWYSLYIRLILPLIIS